MDDASFSQDPMMGGDPNVNGEMPMDDQNAGGPMGNAPIDDQNDNGPMGDATMDGQNSNGETSDDTMSIINQLSDEDREAVRSYAESMLNRDETQSGDEMEQNGEQEPMMEQVIFTKKQLNKIQENFGPSQDELMKKNDRKELPKKQSRQNNSPFSSPKFD